VFLITRTFDNDVLHAAAITTRAINTGATDTKLRCSLDRYTRPCAVDVSLTIIAASWDEYRKLLKNSLLTYINHPSLVLDLLFSSYDLPPQLFIACAAVAAANSLP